MNLNFIAEPLGKFLHFIYINMAFEWYGLAIIIFTFFIRLILLPLNVKQYRSMAKMQEIQPQIQEIQKRYKNDKEKLNQELLKVYQENQVNPAGGCLPLLIQMPILFSLYYVIQSPLTYMLGKKADEITKLLQQIPNYQSIHANMKEISIINYHHLLNMNFLGLNLGMTPTWDTKLLFNNPMSAQYIALLIIPVLTATTTYFSMKYSMAQTAKTSDNPMQNSMQNSMTTMMPIMTLLFTFNVPAGLGLYWIVGSIIQILQQLFMNKFIIKKKKEVVGN